jgi:hypothetical protein
LTLREDRDLEALAGLPSLSRLGLELLPVAAERRTALATITSLMVRVCLGGQVLFCATYWCVGG